MERKDLIRILVETILQWQCPHPLRVAIDGVDASGKTCLADELADALETYPRQVIRASVDSFHNPEAVRRQRGSYSPIGFYHDSYNYTALINELLKPLGPEGNRQYRNAVFDYKRDLPLSTPFQTASDDAILIMDGIFLLRPRLNPYWDLRIYLHTDFSKSVPRGIKRDAELYGSVKEAEKRYRDRYVPGQMMYLKEAHPLDKAEILIDNGKINKPGLLRIPEYFSRSPNKTKF